MTLHLNTLKPLLKSSIAPPRKTRRGVTVVQFAFFLVLAAIVTGTSIATFAGVRQSTRQGQATALLTRTYLAVQEIGGSSRNYNTAGEDLLPSLDLSKKIPVEARRGDASTPTMMSPFDTAITVVGNGGKFTITFKDYAKDNCIALLKGFKDMTKGQAGLESLTVGTPLVMPANAAALEAACSAEI